MFREGFGMTESSPLTHIQPGENAVLGNHLHLQAIIYNNAIILKII